MTGGADPLGAMDSDADVTAVFLRSLAGVDANPDAREGGIPSERLLRFDRRSDGVARRAECDEERVSLCIDDFAAMPGDRIPQNALVLSQELSVAIATELAQQAG